MPQGTLWSHMEMTCLAAVVVYDQVNDKYLISLKATTRTGVTLAMSQTSVKTSTEAALLPEVLAQAVRGFLYGAAPDAVGKPSQWLREVREHLDRS